MLAYVRPPLLAVMQLQQAAHPLYCGDWKFVNTFTQWIPRRLQNTTMIH